MNITTLVENSVADGATGLRPEHGMSLFIEHRGKNILFDTGASDLFARNAAALGIDLKAVDFLVISHAHFDHGGGLARFLEINQTAPVVLLSGARQETYAKILFIKKYIGLARELFDAYPARFAFFDGAREIAPGVTVMANTVREEHRPSGNAMLLVKESGSFTADPFDHELIMVLDEDDGSVVLTGCSHNGILNMLATVYRRRPGIRVKAVLGGFHLANPLTKRMSESRQAVESIAAQLGSLPVSSIYTGHCTGDSAFAVMKRALGDRLAPFQTGSRMEL